MPSQRVPDSDQPDDAQSHRVPALPERRVPALTLPPWKDSFVLSRPRARCATTARSRLRSTSGHTAIPTLDLCARCVHASSFTASDVLQKVSTYRCPNTGTCLGNDQCAQNRIPFDENLLCGQCLDGFYLWSNSWCSELARLLVDLISLSWLRSVACSSTSTGYVIGIVILCWIYVSRSFLALLANHSNTLLGCRCCCSTM